MEFVERECVYLHALVNVVCLCECRHLLQEFIVSSKPFAFQLNQFCKKKKRTGLTVFIFSFAILKAPGVASLKLL